jgi:putative PIN family toxin of toxin-antitoxin system
MIRVVPDTNVLVSAILTSTGNSALIINLFREGKLDFVSSGSILAEVERVLNYPKIRKRTLWDKKQVKEFCLRLGKSLIITEDTVEKNVILDDPEDDKFLFCAAAGKADCIITGDVHLLKLKQFKEVEIVSPKEFLEKYGV